MNNQKLTQQLEIKIKSTQIADFLKKLIVAGIFIITLFPILGDYGNLLYPIGREIFFRMIVEIIFVAYIFLIILDRCYLPKFSKILFSLILFWLFFGLATIFSQDLKFSFWGSFYRGGGFFTLTHFVIFVIILISVLKTWQQWKKIIFLAIGASFPIAIITIVQYFIFINLDRSKIVGTLNNPNFLGAYFLLIFFLTVYFAYLEKKGWLKNFLVLTSLLQLTAIVLTQSRGALLGLVAGILTLIIFLIGKEPKKFKIFFGIILMAIILFSVFISISPHGKTFLNNNPFTFRLLNSIQSIKEGGRLDAWRAGFLGLKEKPILGYGPENFNIPFDKFYLATQEKSKFTDAYFDKAHSILIEILSTTGILGLLSYFMILGAAVFILLRNLKEHTNLKIILFSTLIAYSAQNLFNIDTITSFIYFYLWLGLINFVSQKKDTEEEPEYQNFQTEKLAKKQKIILCIGLILLIPRLLISLKKSSDWKCPHPYIRLRNGQKNSAFFWRPPPYPKALRSRWRHYACLQTTLLATLPFLY